MSIVESKIVTVHEANVEGAIRNTELLRAQQQHFGAEVLKGLEAQNKKLEETVSKWAKVAAGIASVAAAFKFAKAGFEEFGKAQELFEATQGVRLDGLRAASRGLKSDMDLLSIAAKSNAGAFKLTNEQLQLAIKAMEVYEDRGHDSRKVTEAVSSALIEGNTKALRPFGVQIYETGTRAEKFQAIIKALTKDVEKAGVQTDVGTDAWKRQGTEFQNSMSKIKQSVGELVVSLTPLIAKVAELTKSVVDFVTTGIPDWRDKGRGAFDVFARKSPEFRKFLDENVEGGAAGFTPSPADYDAASERSIKAFAERLRSNLQESAVQKMALALEDYLERRAKGEFKVVADLQARLDALEADAEQIERIVANGAAGAPRVTELGGGFSWGGSPRATQANQARSRAGLGGMIDASNQALDAAGQKSRLEQIFGPVEQFDVYATAWQTLQGASTSAYTALITGSESAGKAFKRFIASSLIGISVEMAVKSLREVAEGFSALSNPWTAALAAGHFTAAAKFGAAAAAAGVGARLLGAGGGGGGGGSGGGGAVNTAPRQVGLASDQGSPRVVIAYGDEFAASSPRKRAVLARRLVSEGLGGDRTVELV